MHSANYDNHARSVHVERNELRVAGNGRRGGLDVAWVDELVVVFVVALVAGKPQIELNWA